MRQRGVESFDVADRDGGSVQPGEPGPDRREATCAEQPENGDRATPAAKARRTRVQRATEVQQETTAQAEQAPATGRSRAASAAS